MRIISEFSIGRDKKKGNTKDKVERVAAGVGSVAIGQQAIRSGLPRALGVRLESHSTSRKNAKEIMKGGGYIDPNKSGGGAIRSLENAQGMKDVTDINKAKGKVYITGIHKDAQDRVVNGVKMKADEGNAILNVLQRKAQRGNYRAQAGTDWDKVNAKGDEAYNKYLKEKDYDTLKNKYDEQQKNKGKKSKTIGGKKEVPVDSKVLESIEKGANKTKATVGAVERLKQNAKNTFLPTGKSLYVGGSDQYFNENFKPDFDDPKAMYSTNKVKVSGNRMSATVAAIKREGLGNLMKANKGRVAAGSAILAGGLGASALLAKKALGPSSTTKKKKKRPKFIGGYKK